MKKLNEKMEQIEDFMETHKKESEILKKVTIIGGVLGLYILVFSIGVIPS